MKVTLNEQLDPLEEAHKDYLTRKNEILTKLKTVRDCAPLQWHERSWINQAIEFIKEKEI